MKLIKLSATLSTNSYLKELIKAGIADAETVILAEDQTQGRGQHGNSWYSKAGESLTFSLYRRFEQHPDVFPFMPSMVVALAVKQQLDALKIPAVSIKWPNDIMSYNKKIGGILIENIWSEGKPLHRAIGIGLNLNNSELPGLPSASSLHLQTGKIYDIEEFGLRIAGQIYQNFDDFRVADQQQWYDLYQNALFKKDTVATFSVENEPPFVALVKGVTPDGRLQIETEAEEILSFGLKEIKMHY